MWAFEVKSLTGAPEQTGQRVKESAVSQGLGPFVGEVCHCSHTPFLPATSDYRYNILMDMGTTK